MRKFISKFSLLIPFITISLAVSFFGCPHSVFATALPALTSALITEHTVVLTYDRALNTTSPSTSDFGITDITTSASATPSSITISGERVVLLLPANNFNANDTLTLNYNGTIDFHAIQDKNISGNDAVNLVGQALTNDIGAFITTWTVTDGETITIPTNSDYTYNYNVDWGDSNSDDSNQTTSDSHTYANAGNYTVTITGTFPAIYFNNASDASDLTDIDQWGTNSWQSMDSAFEGCTGLTVLSASDSPDLSDVSDMVRAFDGATNFNSDISGWNVSNVTDMDSMFAGASDFNNGDSGNDESHPLTWGSHTSNVTDMSYMFGWDYVFNQDISDWDTSGVTDMFGMFYSDNAFNQNINDWNVSNVTDMGYMFGTDYNFNQPLDSWDTTNVTDMTLMFQFTPAFNQDISSWNISNVTDMSYMFDTAGLSTANYDALLVAWSQESVQPNVAFSAGSSTYCSSGAVAGRNILTSSPNGWTITDGGQNCGGGSGFITTWNTANPGIDANNQITIPTFSGDTYDYNVDWGDDSTDTGDTGNAQHTYASPGTYTVTITGTFPRIYFNDGGSSDAKKILSVEQWGGNAWDSMQDAFAGCTNLIINATDAPDLSGVTNVDYMFLNDTSLNQDISSWNTSNITSMYGMFQSTTSFDQPLDTWNTSNVTNMGYMFENDPVFNQPLGSWNTSRVTDMDTMFQDDAMFNQDISSWDTSHVTDMSYMFKDDSVFNQPLNSWNTSNVTSMAGMFVNADAFNQPLNTWNVSNVIEMNSMFKNDSLPNLDISSWNVSHVAGMTNFFQIGSGGLSTVNYDKLLEAWSQEPLHTNILFTAGASKYCPSAAAARANIISNYSWSIQDGGLSACSHAVTYTAGPNGTISGVVSQVVNDGSNGTAVTAVANSGYHFVNWSDNSMQNPRTDNDVLGDISVTANFAADPVISTGGVSGGSTYVCTDPKAANYDTYWSLGNTSCEYPIARILKYGSKRGDVLVLQKYLNTHGYFIAKSGSGSVGHETSMFGFLTKKAVEKFQKDHNLIPDGIVGQKTQALMN